MIPPHSLGFRLILPGSMFEDVPLDDAGGKRRAAAMNLLAHVDALIFDLRDNRGVDQFDEETTGKARASRLTSRPVI